MCPNTAAEQSVNEPCVNKLEIYAEKNDKKLFSVIFLDKFGFKMFNFMFVRVGLVVLFITCTSMKYFIWKMSADDI